jgi:hypothetical protein
LGYTSLNLIYVVSLSSANFVGSSRRLPHRILRYACGASSLPPRYPMEIETA